MTATVPPSPLLLMPQRQLGISDLKVSAIGLGAMPMSEFYGPADREASEQTVRRAVELGVTYFDTAAAFGAEPYGEAANEEFLGQALRGHRDEVVLATKFGVRRVDGRRVVDNSEEHIRHSIEESLRRLDTECIDLYYMHRRDPNIPIEETVGIMAKLVADGKVRHLGLSEVTGEELREAHAHHPITAVQSEWSLFTRDIERGLVPAAAELGVGVVAYSPLGRGFLTGALPGEFTAGDVRSRFPRFTGENARRNTALLHPITTIAADRGATPAQVALAWLHQRRTVHRLTVVPIPGTRHPNRLNENLAALELTLTADELALLEPIAAQVTGDRYPDMAETSNAREA